MKRRKIVLVLAVALAMITLFSVTAFAEDTSATSWADTVNAKLESNPLDIKIEYTSDSAIFEGILAEGFVDVTTQEVGFNIVKDLPIGYVIYDSADTPFIDGIRINGNTVESTRICVDLDCATAYTVSVRIDYAEGILGDIARMASGTYDWTKLLENPIITFQAVYYILAILSILFSLGVAARTKKIKVKTADEIAGKVTEAANSATSQVKSEVTATVIAEFMPILQTIVDAVQNVVKAAALTTSKSKDAPLAMLETLKDSANIDVAGLIEEIKAKVEEDISNKDKVREDNLAALKEIVEAHEKSEEPKSDDFKSIF